MRAIAAIVLAVWSTWLFSQPAFADKRVALVIGNSAYKNVNRLRNPANDAAAVVAMFKKAGFDSVDLRLDRTRRERDKLFAARKDVGQSRRVVDLKRSKTSTAPA